jgi:mevalonate kinase
MSSALGAKLSGGGRGGIMIALVEPGKTKARVKTALYRAGAAHIYETEVRT